MLCDLCQENEASIIVHSNIEGKGQKTLHICEECAAQQGLNLVEGIFDSVDLSDFINNIAGTIFDVDSSDNVDSTYEKYKKLKCKDCNLSFDEFRSTGKVGCQNCYNVFEDFLSETFINIHQGNHHLGKAISKPKEKENYRSKISKLEKKLEKIVEKEKYEEAVIVRDKIKSLKNALNSMDNKKNE
ncbi:MAG: UvrB/UvrC motif-containing protein [Verrucomicrobiota bacterium]|nr:UvrB/UvrC motif-containing protein [Verrucomicrobiota bacterium]